MYVFIALILITGVARLFISDKKPINDVVSTETEQSSEEPVLTNVNLNIASPQPYTVVTSPLSISGEARGTWYFEASFPVMLTNWDGLIIAEGVATAAGDWMTEDFVPFTANLEFTNPYNPGDPDFMKKGTLILKKDNPSDLPENDDALEIPINFAP